MLEIPDPAPEMVITLPRRGRIRVTSIEEADALITAAVRAKSMLITLLAFEPAEFDEPEPLPQRTPGAALADEPEYPDVSGGGVPYPPSRAFAKTMAATPLDEAIRNGLVSCPEHHPATSLACARLKGHEPPHRTLDRTEWDDGPAPYHATSGPQCAADDGYWHCTAQRGHGGPDHIAYGASGEVCHRWPVAAPEQQDAAPAHVAEAGAPGLVGRRVEDAHDDSPVPVVGEIVHRVDEEFVDVLWGGASTPLREPLDALRPAREAGQP